MVLRRAAPVLVPLVPEVALIGIRVREVARDGVMDYRLGGLADRGDHALDEEEDEEDAQAESKLASTAPAINVRPPCDGRRHDYEPYRPEHDGVPAGTPVSTSLAASPCNPFNPSLGPVVAQ